MGAGDPLTSSPVLGELPDARLEVSWVLPRVQAGGIERENPHPLPTSRWPPPIPHIYLLAPPTTTATTAAATLGASAVSAAPATAVATCAVLLTYGWCAGGGSGGAGFGGESVPISVSVDVLVHVWEAVGTPPAAYPHLTPLAVRKASTAPATPRYEASVAIELDGGGERRLTVLPSE